MRSDDTRQGHADEVRKREARAQRRTFARDPEHRQRARSERQEQELQDEQLGHRATFATATPVFRSQSTLEYVKPSVPGSAPTPMT